MDVNWFVVSNSLGAFDMIVSEMMGVKVDKIPHLTFAKQKGFLPKGIEEIEINNQLNDFRYKSILKRPKK